MPMNAKYPESSAGKQPRALRDLDSMEELFRLLNVPSPFLHTYAMEVDGAAEIAAWQGAWQKLGRRYPVLSASIRKLPGTRPIFLATDKPPVFEAHPWVEPLRIDELMQNELNASPDGWDDAPVRLKCFHGAGRSLVLLTMNHCAGDGKTSLLLLQDLLAVLAGEPCVGAVEWTTPNRLLGRPLPGPYFQGAVAAGGSESAATLPAPPSARVGTLSLDARETEALLARAKLEKATVQAALVVAFARSRARACPQSPEVRCSTPIDLRGLVAGNENAAGLLISGITQRVNGEAGVPFWELARTVRQGLAEARSLQAASGVVDAVDRMVAEETTPVQLAGKLQQSELSYEMAVTNQAGYKVRTEYGGLRVASLFSAVASGDPAGQNISVNTLHGALGMVHTSRQPLPSLLDQAKTILLEASTD